MSRFKIGTSLSSMADLLTEPTLDDPLEEYPIAGRAINGENRHQGKPRRLWKWDICNQAQYEQLMAFFPTNVFNRRVYITLPKMDNVTSTTSIQHAYYTAIMHRPKRERDVAGKYRQGVTVEFSNLIYTGRDI